MNTEKKTGQANGSQMRITPDEIALIKATFKGNDALNKVMRKMFLPELDPNAPIGQMIDLWMTIPINELSPEDAVNNMKARNSLISHVDQVLMQLQLISNLETQDASEVKKEKDSTK